MALTARDYKKILEIIEILYSVPDRLAMFQAVCEQMQSLIPFQSAAVIPTDHTTGSFLPHKYAGFNVPAESILCFCLYYASLHPLVTNGQHMHSLNKSVRITDALPAYRLADTEYSVDFQMKYDHIFYELSMQIMSPREVNGIGFHRSRKDRDFTNRDKDIIDLLIPHFSRALSNIDDFQKDHALTSGIKSRLQHISLSVRQQEITSLVIQGCSNREIARRLYISEQTVKDHLVDIFEAMQVRRRGELTAKILGINTLA